MSEWWVGRQGANPVGPVSTEMLVRGIVEKKVPEDALVCRVGETEWQHIPQVDELWELAHPEDYRTNITQKPWFAEKPESAPPQEPIADADDESTRVIVMPILPIRAIEPDPNFKPPENAKPLAAAPSRSVSSPKDPKPNTNGSAGASAPRPAAPAVATTAKSAPKAGLGAAPGFSAPSASAAPTSKAAQPAQPAQQSPRGVIAAPRFGTDRVASKPPPAGASIPPAAQTEPVLVKAQPAPSAASTVASPKSPSHTSPSKATNGNRQEASVERAPDSGELPSVPLIPVRPAAAAAPVVPAAKELPRAERPTVSRSEPPRPAQPQPKIPDPTPVLERKHPEVPVDYDDDTVTVIAKSPIVPREPPVTPASFPGAASHGHIPQAPPPAPTPLMPTVVSKPAAPAVPAVLASTTQPSAVFSQQRSALPAGAPPPPPPEVAPADLFDEDFEPPAPPPVKASAHRAVVASDPAGARPAAGTPLPPSVIVSQPPPSVTEDVLQHAVAHLPEHTRPAMRSLRAPGMVQLSIGTLIIGALGLIVLVLFAVLLLR